MSSSTFADEEIRCPTIWLWHTFHIFLASYCAEICRTCLFKLFAELSTLCAHSTHASIVRNDPYQLLSQKQAKSSLFPRPHTTRNVLRMSKSSIRFCVLLLFICWLIFVLPMDNCSFVLVRNLSIFMKFTVRLDKF